MIYSRKYNLADYCFYCERKFNRDNPLLFATDDHVIPLCMGGVNHHNNKVLCCHQCNSLKGNLLPVELRTIILNHIDGKMTRLAKLIRKYPEPFLIVIIDNLEAAQARIETLGDMLLKPKYRKEQPGRKQKHIYSSDELLRLELIPNNHTS